MEVLGELRLEDFSMDFGLTLKLTALLLFLRFVIERNKDKYPAAVNFFRGTHMCVTVCMAREESHPVLAGAVDR